MYLIAFQVDSLVHATRDSMVERGNECELSDLDVAATQVLNVI